VTGEGELTIRQVLRDGQLHSLQPVVIQGTSVSNLDELPMPMLSLFPIDMIREYPSVMFSRGCPYQCSYCMSRNGGIDGRTRWKTPKRAIDEIADLVCYASPSQIFIDDDTLLKNPKWVKQFCELYAGSFRIPFFCNARPETVRPEVVALLRGAGCEAIGIGIESGSSRIREQVLNRPMSNDVIARAFRVAKATGLKTWSFNMVGIPGETLEDLKATIELNDYVNTDYVRVSLFTAYPGTPMFSGDASKFQPYIRRAIDLPEELQETYKGWIRQLDRESRLWFTDSEEDFIRLNDRRP
jgi:radical SAM superfamily enzyme YgiQ (UPF0313 family)